MNQKKSLSRKGFLKTLGISLVAFPVVGCSVRNYQLSEDHASLQNNPCGLTDPAEEGPFFVANTAEVVNINYTNLPGIPIKVQGKVYGGKRGNTPLANVKIEIWHADREGVYRPTGSGDVTDYDSSEIALRGHVYTNAKGEYAFHSIRPGIYGSRRRHIHYKITAPQHRPLTTQTYWQAEKNNQRDSVDRNTEECRYIHFRKNQRGVEVGTFDIYLKA
ncbi:MAG TPA: hypothetical protein DCS93_02290 [Microscillaceae bacterium]|nr:hypothetical protein [Microscillaceae bacterium]